MRGRAMAWSTGVFAGALVVLSAAGAAGPAGAATTVPPPPAPSAPITIVPGVVISRAPTTPPPATAPPATAPPATAPRTNPPAATQAPRPATTVVRTTVPPTTVAPTTVPTTVATTTVAPATTAAAVVPVTATSVDETATSVATAPVGDSAASSRNSRIAWTLALMGLLVGGLTLWFWLATRPVPVGMAGLAEMGTPRWWRADGARREQILARSRKGLAPIDDSLLVIAGGGTAAGAVAAGAVAEGPGDADPVDAVDPVDPVDLPVWARDAVADRVLSADPTPSGGLPVPSLTASPWTTAPPAVVATDAAFTPVPVAPGPEAPSAGSPWRAPVTPEEAASAADHG